MLIAVEVTYRSLLKNYLTTKEGVTDPDVVDRYCDAKLEHKGLAKVEEMLEKVMLEVNTQREVALGGG